MYFIPNANQALIIRRNPHHAIIFLENQWKELKTYIDQSLLPQKKNRNKARRRRKRPSR